VLKRMFSLAIQAGKLVHKPHFPMMRENNVRAGFFEREQYLSVLRHLPTSMQPVVTFAFVTGWRINSEILSLQWRQVDLKLVRSGSTPVRRRTWRVASST
jgi:integrase